MQSLRTRRPSTQAQSREPSRYISEDQQLQGDVAIPPARPRPNARPVNREIRKSRVDDRIKRRMSTRYADADAQGDIPDVPALPGGRYQGGNARNTRASGRDMVREDPRAVDVDILQQDNFDPDAYLRLKLNNSTEAELKTLQSSLVASKNATAADLQYNIFKNYEEFILISKEISTLENDMLELKESLSEWKSMPSLLRMDESSSQTQDRKRAQRSSVADLRALYASQMQELHSKIEGSAKFVPAIPGRHVISQSPELYHLNPATYKVEYTVVLVLLDDSVLVAKRRRRRNGERGRLVAERCWNLSEIVLVDVKDSAGRTNIIKLRHGREGHVFRTERSSEKKNLLSSVRQTSEELATRRRKEREGEHERRMSVWKSGDRSSMGFGDAPPMPDWTGDVRRFDFLGIGSGSAKEKAEGDVRWINEFCDSLTVAIALREWDEAVKLVEDGQKHLSTKPGLKDRLNHLISNLISALLHSLSDHRQRKTAVTQLSGYLARLHSTPAARTAFLEARAELIRKRIRAIPLEGDIPLYIFDLAIIVFTAIKHTAEWFLASFKENESVSYFVQWSKEQIENYCTMFRKQLDSTNDEQILHECLDITRAQSKRLLVENGLDFTFLLTDLNKGLTSSSSGGGVSGPGPAGMRSPISRTMTSASNTSGISGISRPVTPRSPSDGPGAGGSGIGVGSRRNPPQRSQTDRRT